MKRSLSKHFLVGLGLLLVTGIAFSAEEITLPNGSKIQGEIQNNRLMLITPGGLSPAPDGQYRLGGGRMVVVQHGIIIEGTQIGSPAIHSIGSKQDVSLRPPSSFAPVGSKQLTPNKQQNGIIIEGAQMGAPTIHAIGPKPDDPARNPFSAPVGSGKPTPSVAP